MALWQAPNNKIIYVHSYKVIKVLRYVYMCTHMYIQNFRCTYKKFVCTYKHILVLLLPYMYINNFVTKHLPYSLVANGLRFLFEFHLAHAVYSTCATPYMVPVTRVVARVPFVVT